MTDNQGNDAYVSEVVVVAENNDFFLDLSEGQFYFSFLTYILTFIYICIL